MKNYEAPELFVDEYVADTMIASSLAPKNNQADNNQNCWACDSEKGQIIGDNECVWPKPALCP